MYLSHALLASEADEVARSQGGLPGEPHQRRDGECLVLEPVPGGDAVPADPARVSQLLQDDEGVPQPSVDTGADGRPYSGARPCRARV